MTIDVLKAMGVTQPNAVERERRPVGGAPFADMLDRQDHGLQPVAPERKNPRPSVEEARPHPERRDVAETRDSGEAGQAVTTPAREESRAPQAPRENKADKAPAQQAATETGAQAPETADMAPRDGTVPRNATPKSGATQADATTPAPTLLLDAPVETDGSADQAAAPAQPPQPVLSVLPPTTLSAVLAQPAVAIALAKGEQNGLSGAPVAAPQDGKATPAAASAGTPVPVTADGQEFLLPANPGDDAVTVRAGAMPASPLSLATGPVISPETAVVAMSAVDVPTPGTPRTEAAAPRHLDEAAADPAETSAPAKAAAPTAAAASTAAINTNAKTASLENAATPETKGSANGLPSGSATAQAGALSDQALRLGEQPGAATPGSSTNAPAHPRFATPTQPPASQVAAKLVAQAGDGGRSYDIQLDPESLGRVRVHLDVGKDGAVTASISADRADTLAMLRSDARTLQQALQDAGLSTTSGSLDFSLSGQRRDGGTWGSGYAGTRQAQLDDGAGDLRQAEMPPPSAAPAGRPGRGSLAVDVKI